MIKKSTKEIKPKTLAIANKLSPMDKEITSLKISDQSSLNKAVEYLSQVNQFLDKLTEEKEKLTKPINEALKEIRARYKPAETIANELISHLRAEMSKYQTELMRIKRIEEDKIAAKLASGKMTLNTAVKKMEAVVAPEKSTETDSGKVTFRTDKILRVVNLELIPREYFDLNESKLLKVLKSGIVISGAILEEVQTPINNR